MNKQEFEKYIKQGGKLFVVLEAYNLFLAGDVVELRFYYGDENPTFYYPNHEPRDREQCIGVQTWHFLNLKFVRPCVAGKPFKVGDIVIARWDRYFITDSSTKCRVVSLTPLSFMKKADMVVTPIEGNYFYGVPFNVSSAYFKLAEEEEEEETPPTLEVTQDGSTITVKLTENGNVTEASAKCSPTDTFDYLTGVQIALTRLAQKTGKPPKIYLPKDTTAYQVELL